MKQVIDQERLHQVRGILERYKAGKANLEQRIIGNEQWYKLRHWEYLRKKDRDQVEPVSGWLFNSIANKHADAMDSFPVPSILPREAADREEAKRLTAILPVILDQCDFEQVYSDVYDDKLKNGCGVYGIFWDKDRCGGLGDISVREIDPVKLFWEPGITDIQHSRNVFHVELVDNDLLEEAWEQLRGNLGNSSVELSKYIYDDTVDTTGKSAVVDWYYKKRQGNRTVLHYCKFVNDEVLFATENDPLFRENGWYDHGQYPFVFDPLFRVKGSPWGFGYIDVAKSAQEYIDRGNQAMMENLLANATPRHFIRSDGSVNEEEYLDVRKPLIHVDGGLGQDSILPMHQNPLPGIYVELINGKINELKETTGTRDVSTGGTASGVIAASAIAAMQEAGSKLSRDSTRASYRAYRRILLQIIELIRQFYDLPRCFRIMGEDFLHYSNEGLVPQRQEGEFGMDMGFRMPLFDVEVSAVKQSPYSRMNQNELALRFYQAGIFDPSRAEQALVCLEMMDFDQKESITNKIAQNAEKSRQQLMAMAGMQAKGQPSLGGTAMASGSDMGQEKSPVQHSAQMPVGSKPVQMGMSEPSVTRQAKQQTAMGPTTG